MTHLFPFLVHCECFPAGKDVILLPPVKDYFSMDKGVDLRCPLYMPLPPPLTAWRDSVEAQRVYSYHIPTKVSGALLRRRVALCYKSDSAVGSFVHMWDACVDTTVCPARSLFSPGAQFLTVGP